MLAFEVVGGAWCCNVDFVESYRDPWCGVRVPDDDKLKRYRFPSTSGVKRKAQYLSPRPPAACET